MPGSNKHMPLAFATRATARRLSYLHTSSVSQIQPIEFESQEVVSVDHLVRHRILNVPAISHLVCAYQYAIVGLKAPSLPSGTSSTSHVFRVDFRPNFTYIFLQESDGRTCVAIRFSMNEG